MKSDQRHAHQSLRRARLVLPLFLAGVAIAGLGLALRNASPRTASAASVRDEILAVVETGGYIGPFVVQAESFDQQTNEFTNFLAETDELMVAAKRAALDINAETDTISFELFDVTIVRVPEGESELPMVTKESYLLGPINYNRDIIETSPGSGLRGQESAKVESGD